MEPIRAVFSALGFDNVSTWIASGNVIFDTDGPVDVPVVEAALGDAIGFEVPVFARSGAEVREVAAARPFGDVDMSAVEISFLAAVPSAAAAADVVARATPKDRLALERTELYWLHDPTLGDSEHSEAKVAAILGMATTRRAWRTVQAIVERFLQA